MGDGSTSNTGNFVRQLSKGNLGLQLSKGVGSRSANSFARHTSKADGGLQLSKGNGSRSASSFIRQLSKAEGSRSSSSFSRQNSKGDGGLQLTKGDGPRGSKTFSRQLCKGEGSRSTSSFSRQLPMGDAGFRSTGTFGNPAEQHTRKSIVYTAFFLWSFCVVWINERRAVGYGEQRFDPFKNIKLPSMQKTSIVRSDSLDRSEPQGPIPRIIWFTYKTNILAQKTPKLYYDNVVKTVAAYRAAWNNSEAPVYFLNDIDCHELLRRLDQQEHTSLLDFFRTTRKGAIKADICRLAALYLYGGYYFDVDLEVVKPVQLDPKVTFSTSLDGSDAYFFQAYWASTPRHPILKENLRTMTHFYKNRTGTCFENAAGLMGCCTLMQAWNQTMQRGHVKILQESHLNRMDLYPNMTHRGYRVHCNWVVHDPSERVVYFYSRVVGSRNCWF